jgi:MFS family permease
MSLERVTAYGEAMDGAGEVAGPALAGLAVAAIGLGSSFWLAAGVFLVAAGAMWLFVPTWPMEHREPEPYLSATWAGLRVVWRDRVLRDTAVTLALFGFFITPIVLVLTAEFEPDDRATALGLVIAVFAFGGVVGAVIFAALADRLPRRPTLIAGFALVSVGLAAMGPTLGSLTLVLVIAALTGLASGPLAPLLSVIVQDRATDQYRGRIISTMGTVWLIAGPLAVLVSGLLVEATSPGAVLVMIGAGSAASTVFAALTPGLRHIERADLVPS